MEALIEHLADAEHASWARWMGYLFSKCAGNPDGHLCIPPELVERWQRQVETPYADLTEREKQSDRDEVALVLPFIEAWQRQQTDSVREALVTALKAEQEVDVALARLLSPILDGNPPARCNEEAVSDLARRARDLRRTALALAEGQRS